MRAPSDGGSTDPDKNVTLFNAIKKARADGVPKANIESALQKVRACIMSFFFFVVVASAVDYVAPMLFSLADVGHILGCGRKGWDGTADNLRGACSWLYRTYHVRVRTAPFLNLGPGVLTRERECLTDNGNRTLHQIREILNAHKYVGASCLLFASFVIVSPLTSFYLLRGCDEQRAVRDGYVHVPPSGTCPSCAQ